MHGFVHHSSGWMPYCIVEVCYGSYYPVPVPCTHPLSILATFYAVMVLTWPDLYSCIPEHRGLEISKSRLVNIVASGFKLQAAPT